METVKWRLLSVAFIVFFYNARRRVEGHLRHNSEIIEEDDIAFWLKACEQYTSYVY